MLRRLRIENLVLIREAELELAPGLNAITGETGAGKTILAQAIGLLLGAKGDVGFVGPDATEAYVEAELDLPAELLEEDGLEALDGAASRRRGRARPRPPRLRRRAHARVRLGSERGAGGSRGRGGAADRDVRAVRAAAARAAVVPARRPRRLLRRGSAAPTRRPAPRVARPPGRAAPARGGRGRGLARSRSCGRSPTTPRASRPGAEESLRAERERLRHVDELARAASAAAEALAPDEGDGAAGLAALAERAVAPLESLAVELARAGEELRDATVRLRDTAAELRAFLQALEAEPGRLEHVESELERIADLKRRFRTASFDELLARAAEARVELAGGGDPVEAAERAAAAAQARVGELAGALRDVRRAAVDGPEAGRAGG